MVSPIVYCQLFILLIMGHLIGDYILQSENVAIGKNFAVDRKRLGVPWFYWMGAHCSVHAMIVYFLSGSVALAVVEFVSHWCIDSGKCAGWYSLSIDQTLHVLCKAMYIPAMVLIS